MVSFGSLRAVAGTDGCITIQDISAGELSESPLGVATATISGSIRSLCWSADSKYIATGDSDGRINVWTTAPLQCVITLEGHKLGVSCLSYSRLAGETLLSGSADRALRIWNTRTGSCEVLECHKSGVNDVRYSADERYFASASSDRFVFVWSNSSHEVLRILAHAAAVTSLFFLHDRLVTGSWAGQLRLWHFVDNVEVVKTLESDLSGSIIAMALSPNFKYFITLTLHGHVMLWDAETLTQLREWIHTNSRGLCVAFSHCSRFFTVGAKNSKVRVFSVAKGSVVATLEALDNVIFSAQFSPSQPLLLTGGVNGALLWDMTLGEVQTHLKGHTAISRALSFSPNGMQLVSGADDCSVRFWCFGHEEHRVDEARAAFVVGGWGSDEISVHVMLGHKKPVLAVTISRDSRYVVSGSEDCDARIWEVGGTDVVCTNILCGHQAAVTSVDISPNGELVSTGSLDHTVRVFDTANAHCIHVLRGHMGHVVSVNFTSDGLFLCSKSDDKGVLMWELASASVVSSLQGHSAYIFAKASCGTLNATSARDNSIHIWTAHQRNPLLLHILRGHSQHVTSLAFSMCGHFLVSQAVESGETCIWETGRGVLLKSIAKTVGRPTTVHCSDNHLHCAITTDLNQTFVWRANNPDPCLLFENLPDDSQFYVLDEALEFSNDEMLAKLAAIPFLNHLVKANLSDCMITDVGALIIADIFRSVPSLSKIILDGSNLGNDGLRALAKLTIARQDACLPKVSFGVNVDEKLPHYTTMMRKWSKLADDLEPSSSAKVFFCGFCGSGKSSLRKSLTKGLLEGFFVNTKKPDIIQLGDRTRGINIVNVPTKNNTVAIWDFGGHDEFHVLHDRFMADQGTLFVVFCNLAKEYSLDQEHGLAPTVKQFSYDDELAHLVHWCRYIGSHQQHARVMIVGSRGESAGAAALGKTLFSDLARRTSDLVNLQESMWCLECIAPRSLGVQRFFQNLLHESQLVMMRTLIPKTSKAIAQVLPTLRLRAPNRPMRWLTYVEMVRENVADLDESLIFEASAYLHTTGDIIFFSAVPALCGLVFLEPALMCDCIGRILSPSSFSGSLPVENGKVDARYLRDVFPHMSIQDTVELLHCMEILAVVGDDRVIFPVHLTASPPPLIVDEVPAVPASELTILTRRVCVPIVSHGYFPRLQVRLHNAHTSCNLFVGAAQFRAEKAHGYVRFYRFHEGSEVDFVVWGESAAVRAISADLIVLIADGMSSEVFALSNRLAFDGVWPQTNAIAINELQSHFMSGIVTSNFQGAQSAEMRYLHASGNAADELIEGLLSGWQPHSLS